MICCVLFRCCSFSARTVLFVRWRAAARPDRAPRPRAAPTVRPSVRVSGGVGEAAGAVGTGRRAAEQRGVARGGRRPGGSSGRGGGGGAGPRLPGGQRNGSGERAGRLLRTLPPRYLLRARGARGRGRRANATTPNTTINLLGNATIHTSGRRGWVGHQAEQEGSDETGGTKGTAERDLGC